MTDPNQAVVWARFYWKDGYMMVAASIAETAETTRRLEAAHYAVMAQQTARAEALVAQTRRDRDEAWCRALMQHVGEAVSWEGANAVLRTFNSAREPGDLAALQGAKRGEEEKP